MSRIAFAFVLLCFASATWAACSKDERSVHFDRGWLWTYTGSLGDQTETALTIVFEHDTLTAILFEPRSRMNIWLDGKIHEDGKFELRTRPTSKHGVSLKGHFLEHDPRGKFTSKLNCEVLSGTAILGEEQVPFIYGLEHGYVGSIEHRYARIGAQDDETVERNATRFVEAVSKGDKRGVASSVSYPVRVNGIRGHKSIDSPDELLREYDRIFMPEFAKAISKSRPYHMFVTKYDQALLDRGLVTFTGEGKVAVIMNWHK